jgi:hypothetical protein
LPSGVRRVYLTVLASSKTDKDAWAMPGTWSKSLSPFKKNDSICGYCERTSNWADCLPRARNLTADRSLSYEFVYGLNFVQGHLT